jgi:hypothetical protein
MSGSVRPATAALSRLNGAGRKTDLAEALCLRQPRCDNVRARGTHWSARDGRSLAKRADSKALRGWGRADQVLPDTTNQGDRTVSGR